MQYIYIYQLIIWIDIPIVHDVWIPNMRWMTINYIPYVHPITYAYGSKLKTWGTTD